MEIGDRLIWFPGTQLVRPALSQQVGQTIPCSVTGSDLKDLQFSSLCITSCAVAWRRHTAGFKEYEYFKRIFL